MLLTESSPLLSKISDRLYRNFFFTLVLLCLFSYFVAGFKLYFWTLMHGTYGFSLETISALLALGS